MLNSRLFKTSSPHWHRRLWVLTCVYAFAAAGLGNILVLSSCAHTPAGVQREERLLATGSNVVATVQPLVQALPPPTSHVLEGALALATAQSEEWARVDETVETRILH
jgi:hypothetical protein